MAFFEKMEPAGVARFARNGANGLVERDLDGVVVDLLQAGDAGRLAVHAVLGAGDHVQEVGVERLGGGIEHAVERVDDVVGRQDVAVVELDARAQVEGVLETVSGHIPALGQAGHQFRLARRGGDGLDEAIEDVERQEVLLGRQLRVSRAGVGGLGHGQGLFACFAGSAEAPR